MFHGGTPLKSQQLTQASPRQACTSINSRGRHHVVCNSDGGRGGLILPGGGRSKTAAEIAAERELLRRQQQGGGTVVQQQTSSSDLIMNSAQRSFRPPPGFIDATLRGQEAPQMEEGLDVDGMLSQIRSDAGVWHDLAKLLPMLARKGVDALAVEDATGLERPQQNIWTVSASVYDSIKQAEGTPEDVLEYFSQEGGDRLLYELRFLGIDKRVACADYISRNDLDQRDALVLARSVKEHERRDGHKLGFDGDLPGDCLAFKYYRDALETKTDRGKEQYIKQGLECASSPSAAHTLRTVIEPPEQVAASNGAVGAQLEMLRFTQEELGVRPVAVAGTYGEATLAELTAAATVHVSGAFNTFRTDTAAVTEWVSLPAWNIILLAKAPVALYIPDCSQIAEIQAATNSTKKEDIAKLKGPGLLVCTRDEEQSPEAYHVAAGASGALRLHDGSQPLPEGDTICARVLFCCRPPGRQAGASSQTAELLMV